MRFFSEKCGIGPWYYAERRTIEGFYFRGKNYDIEFSTAFAYNRKLQFEIIEPLNEVPSLFKEWLDRHPDGDTMVHHYAAWPIDYDAAVERVRARGFAQVQGGLSAFGAFSYFENPASPNFIIELAPMHDARKAIYDRMEEAARGWDGLDPIRMGFPRP